MSIGSTDDSVCFVLASNPQNYAGLKADKAHDTYPGTITDIDVDVAGTEAESRTVNSSSNANTNSSSGSATNSNSSGNTNGRLNAVKMSRSDSFALSHTTTIVVIVALVAYFTRKKDADYRRM